MFIAKIPAKRTEYNYLRVPVWKTKFDTATADAYYSIRGTKNPYGIGKYNLVV